MSRHLLAALAAAIVAAAAGRATAQAAPAPQGTPTPGVAYSKAQLDSMLSAAASARKQTVAANMNLTDAEAKGFWPVYDQYRAAINKIRQQQWTTLQKELTGTDSLTDKQVKQLTSAWLDLRVQEMQLRKSYYAKFLKVLSPRKVARYYQIEHRLDLLVQLAVSQEIPLVN